MAYGPHNLPELIADNIRLGKENARLRAENEELKKAGGGSLKAEDKKEEQPAASAGEKAEG